MKLYSVFEPPKPPTDPDAYAESLRFVRHGWSLAALFVPLIWMAIRRLWLALVGYVLLVVAIQLLGQTVSPVIVGGLSAAMAIVIMLEAGQLRLESMAAKGWREIAVLEARNQRAAEQRFFAEWLSNRARNEKREASAEAPRPVKRPASAQPPALPGMTR